jgi:hypothetical protein
MLKKLGEKINVFNLDALLLKPVQRILKYPLLLNELIKVSIKNIIQHVDKSDSVSAIFPIYFI